MVWTVDQIAEGLRNYSPYGTTGEHVGGDWTATSGDQTVGNTDWQGPPAWMLAGMKSGDPTVNSALQLQLMQKYDPNAYLQPEDGFGTPARLMFDQSKLPQQEKPGLVQFAAGQDLRFHNPNAIYNDSNYGPMTVPGNAHYQSDKPDWMSIVGPMLVGGFAGIAGGGLGLVGNAITRLPNIAAMFSNAVGGGQQKSQPFSNATGPQDPSSLTPQKAALLRALTAGGR